MGYIIGIAFASYTEGQNLNFAIPVEYLHELILKASSVQSISLVKAKTKTTSPTIINSNIIDGVIVRNIALNYNGCQQYVVATFSILNKLSYTISNIKILFISYDASNVIADYYEGTTGEGDLRDIVEIKPNLAKTVGRPSPGTCDYAITLFVKSGYKVKYRVLDFKIVEE